MSYTLNTQYYMSILFQQSWGKKDIPFKVKHRLLHLTPTIIKKAQCLPGGPPWILEATYSTFPLWVLLWHIY